MSAFMHDSAHIDAMIHAGRTFARDGLGWKIPGQNPERFGKLDADTATATGQMLLRENAESVAYRYNMKDLDNPADGGTRSIEYLGYLAQADEYKYDPRAARKEFSPVEIMNATDSYEYQSCEHPEWETSEARAFCRTLKDAAIRALPGYLAADTWAITQ